jgi:hypothetical protein
MATSRSFCFRRTLLLSSWILASFCTARRMFCLVTLVWMSTSNILAMRGSQNPNLKYE